ncbi:uncharacterized protein F4822DRAFT_127028 [Hypoxylon trugodes]|uniref:uncharacterized protein n=1 Tax=Hypoxylon trugodes TaxID=326681 RepID=UPI00219BEDD8|nr:uncharacterized protein F4822DRAFT_127028 [Hypoxylon trugodes]KAI1392366.1 hypothetical protein F4822DRAFT_127028 [Hypoxylon trugodes]
MGDFEPLMNFNLPELLAGDLEESEQVFKSRQLTAGAPAPMLADDGSKRRYSLQDSSLSAAPTAYALDVMSRARSLQNVHEKRAQFLNICCEPQPNNSDSDTASSESSGGLVPPSIDTRDASVTTTATSVTSERMEPSKLKLVIQDKKQVGQSWMDLDDATSPDRRHNSMVNFPSPAQLLSLQHDLDESRSMSLNSAVPRPKVVGASAPSPTILRSPGAEERRKPAKKPLVCPTTFPKRHSSLLYQNYPVLPEINVSPLIHTPSTQHFPIQTNGMPSSPGIKTPTSAPPRTPRTFRAEANPNDNRVDDDIRMSFPSPAPSRHEHKRFSRTEGSRFPEIAPLGIDVESWLESSVDNFPYHAQTKADGGHTPLPLPPDVIDTLRVSITCFPETMLQCSSLSIETIRSHSRKLRYKATSPASLYSESPVSADSSEPSKQSKWKWLPLKKQTSYPTQMPPSPQRSGFFESMDGKYSPTWPRRPDWTAIQNLFPSGTDYLCDALYAHLVAYNYITSLCPRSALVNTPASRPSSKSSAASNMSLGLSIDLRTSVDIRSSTSDGTAIPLKAASLLGLQDDPNSPIPEPPSSRCNTLRSKRSFFAIPRSASFYEVNRPTTSTGGFGRRPPPSDQNEQILKDLRLGLARCVSRLVATLRMTNGGGLAPSPDGVASLKREEDPDFMRALCEIVRLSEERYM